MTRFVVPITLIGICAVAQQSQGSWRLAELPVGTELVKDFTYESEKQTDDRLPRLIKETFRRGDTVSELIEEYADGSQLLSYGIFPYRVTETGLGISIADLRTVEESESLTDEIFRELHWLKGGKPELIEDSEDRKVLKLSEFELVIDPSDGRPLSATGPNWEVRYTYRRIEPGSVRLPVRMARRLDAYEAKRDRASVGLLGKDPPDPRNSGN